MTSNAAKITGSCICGGVAFEIDGPLKPVVACHCTLCRKQTSHYLATTAAWRDHFTLTESRGLKWYRSGAKSRRGFCGDCGSVLFFDVDGDDKISIASGALKGPTGLTMAAHIYVANKGDYYEITDDLPSFPQGDDLDLMPPRE